MRTANLEHRKNARYSRPEKMMAPGAMIETTTNSHVGIFSFSIYGYCSDKSTSENGRLYGSLSANPPPIAAIAIIIIQSKRYEATSRLAGIQLRTRIFAVQLRTSALHQKDRKQLYPKQGSRQCRKEKARFLIRKGRRPH